MWAKFCIINSLLVGRPGCPTETKGANLYIPTPTMSEADDGEIIDLMGAYTSGQTHNDADADDDIIDITAAHTFTKPEPAQEPKSATNQGADANSSTTVNPFRDDADDVDDELEGAITQDEAPFDFNIPTIPQVAIPQYQPPLPQIGSRAAEFAQAADRRMQVDMFEEPDYVNIPIKANRTPKQPAAQPVFSPPQSQVSNESDHDYANAPTLAERNATAGVSTTPLGTHIAAFAYEARELDELTLEKGDYILVHQMGEDGWYTGALERPDN